MELRDIWRKRRGERVYGGVIAALLVILACFNPIVAALSTILVVGVYWMLKKTQSEQDEQINAYLDSVSTGVTEASSYAIRNLPIGIAIIDQKSHLVWGNSVFRDWQEDIEEGERLQKIVPDTQLAKFWGKSGHFFTRIDQSHYRVIYKYLDLSDHPDGDEGYLLLFFDDITEAEERRLACEAAMPAFCYIQIDNLTEITSELTEVQRSALWSEVNTCVLDAFDRLDGFIKSYSNNNYIACISRASLDRLMETNFDILDRVRAIHTVNRIPVTLSIGCAYHEGPFREQAEQARLSLDVALGRGGDQAVVRMGDDTKTFGGKSKAVEKNTRVRARVVAQALRELVGQADNVLIMGHASEDYDALGAAIGVAHMARVAGTPAHIVVSPQRQNVEKLLKTVENDPELAPLIIGEEEAGAYCTPNAILFVVDAHRPEMLAMPELIDRVQTRVVIDHHRRSNAFVPNPIITYLEPSSSSASELVTELLQYFSDEVDLSEVEASALYAGLVVDTKNFAQATGIRTFDAASYLRRSGASTKLVHDLFAIHFDAMLLRAQILAHAERIDDDIVCVTIPDDTPHAQILAGQIADSLVTTEGIHTSFAIYHNGEGYSVSARSDGEVSVQLVMESLGGGGHQTVAATKFVDRTPAEIRDVVVAAIRAEKKGELS